MSSNSTVKQEAKARLRKLRKLWEELDKKHPGKIILTNGRPRKINKLTEMAKLASAIKRNLATQAEKHEACHW